VQNEFVISIVEYRLQLGIVLAAAVSGSPCLTRVWTGLLSHLHALHFAAINTASYNVMSR